MRFFQRQIWCFHEILRIRRLPQHKHSTQSPPPIDGPFLWSFQDTAQYSQKAPRGWLGVQSAWWSSLYDSWKDPFHKMQSFFFLFYICSPLWQQRPIQRDIFHAWCRSISLFLTQTLAGAHVHSVITKKWRWLFSAGWMAAGAGDTFFW